LLFLFKDIKGLYRYETKAPRWCEPKGGYQCVKDSDIHENPAEIRLDTLVRRLVRGKPLALKRSSARPAPPARRQSRRRNPSPAAVRLSSASHCRYPNCTQSACGLHIGGARSRLTASNIANHDDQSKTSIPEERVSAARTMLPTQSGGLMTSYAPAQALPVSSPHSDCGHSASPVITPLPHYQRLLGPVTQARIVRLFLLYLALLATGSALLAFADNDPLRVFGMGLAIPGGGFLAHPDICDGNGMSPTATALFALGAFGVSLAIWFGTGNVLAPPLTWLASAIAAGAMGQGGIRPGSVTILFSGVSAALALLFLSMGCWFLAARRQRGLDNAYLAAQAENTASIFTAPAARDQAEMTLEHLQRLRFALDRALQPLSEFNGFENLDQFQTAATRYQLNFLGYSVALTQARYTPAFSGYMHEAQIALLDKQRQHRVWKYWRLENLWGNLRSDPDPTARENIMFTGFVALQIALFAASTGRGDFGQTGRFALHHPNGQHYAHDAASLVTSMEREFKLSHFYLIACEPNWIYPLCNTIGANAILAMDAQNNESRWAMHARDFRHQLETEFLDGFGRYIPCRSARTGLPFPALGGAMPLAMPCFFLNSLAPDIARRQWLLLRRRFFDRAGTFRRRAFWPVDTGNYGFSRGSAYAATALAAVELGDERVYDECMHGLEEACPSVLKNGVIHRRKSSVWAHGVELMARAGARDAFRDIIAAPRRAGGPRLEKLAYPAVLVASAHADGGSLRAVLYAGTQHMEHAIGLAGLEPGAAYRVTGALPALVTADAQGNAQLKIVLAGRTEMTVNGVH
jgi:hypothetical protein